MALPISACFRRRLRNTGSRLRSAWRLGLLSAGAVTVSDTSGNVRLATGSQGGRRQRHKDDLAAAMILAVATGADGTGSRAWLRPRRMTTWCL